MALVLADEDRITPYSVAQCLVCINNVEMCQCVEWLCGIPFLCHTQAFATALRREKGTLAVTSCVTAVRIPFSAMHGIFLHSSQPRITFSIRISRSQSQSDPSFIHSFTHSLIPTSHSTHPTTGSCRTLHTHTRLRNVHDMKQLKSKG